MEEFEEFVDDARLQPRRGAESAVKPRHFQKLVERMRGTPEEKPIAFLMLRTMQKARYDPANMGHFGLAAESYTHFTSPIRRYPDLSCTARCASRATARMTEDRRDELTEDLPEIARHTSERERRADDAERELVQWKKVRFMADKVGDEFDGYITGVSAFGLFIELIEHFVEGMVHVSTMADDYYRFVERAHMLQRREHRQGLSARRPVQRAGDQGGHGAPADRPRAGRDPRRGARVGAEPRAAPQQGASRSRTARAGRSAQQRPGVATQPGAGKQRPRRRKRARAGGARRRSRPPGEVTTCDRSSSARPGTSITARARSCAR